VVPEQEAGTAEIGRRGRFTPRIVARPGSLSAVLTEVSLGAGCAIVPHAVVDHVRMPGVCYRELAGKTIPSEIAAAYRRHEKAPAVRAFIAQLNQAG
jgi:DNA-binding transcriptional LysR family regulator